MSEFAGKENQPQKDKYGDVGRARQKPPGPRVVTDGNAILQLQRTIGNQAVLRMLESRQPKLGLSLSGHSFGQTPLRGNARVTTQSKLSISTPGDMYEQEADRIAGQVMRMPASSHLQRTCACGGGCPSCQNRQDTHEYLQTKSAQTNDSADSVVPPVVHEALNSSGQPLDPATRAFMEPRFGHDFSAVRTHADSNADQANRALSARAFTYGRDIFFRQGEHDLASLKGKALLAHELHHTLQQQRNPASHQIQRQSEEDDPLWFLKGTKTRTAQPDKTSTPGYTPNILKDPYFKQLPATSKEELTLLDNFLGFLAMLDRKVDSLKGDATQKVGAQIYGTQSSNKDSPGAKPAKNFIDLGSGDFKELKEHFDLLLTVMGDRMPTNTRQAIESAREKFDKFEELKDPQKAVEFLHEKIEEVKEIIEAREKEARERDLAEKRAKAPASASKEQSDTKAVKATKIYDGKGKDISLKSTVEFTVLSPNGRQEEMTHWWQIYMKATDGSGLFRLTLYRELSTFEISTFGDELYSLGGLPTEQVFSHYPKGYKYRYVGDSNLLRLLPSH